MQEASKATDCLQHLDEHQCYYDYMMLEESCDDGYCDGHECLCVQLAPDADFEKCKAKTIGTVTFKRRPPALPRTFADPHMVNMRGESFSVRKRGVYTLVDINRDSTADGSLLHIEALVEPIEAAACPAMFVTRITISGTWLGFKPTLTFVAGTDPRDHAHVKVAHQAVQTFVAGVEAGFKVGNSSILTVDEFTSLVPQGIVKVMLPTRAVKAPMLVNHHSTTMMASVKVGHGIVIKISWVVERVPAGSLAYSLWLSSSDLSAAGMPIGGLLGLGDHGAAVMPDAECFDKSLKQ